jgi:hypothetical protein
MFQSSDTLCVCASLCSWRRSPDSHGIARKYRLLNEWLFNWIEEEEEYPGKRTFSMYSISKHTREQIERKYYQCFAYCTPEGKKERGAEKLWIYIFYMHTYLVPYRKGDEKFEITQTENKILCIVLCLFCKLNCCSFVSSFRFALRELCGLLPFNELCVWFRR